MRPLVKNEKGYVLILVLLIIVIIAIMTPPVISKIMSSSTQFQKVEEDLQLEKLGDMGVLYTERAIDKARVEGGKSIKDLVVLKNNKKPPSYPTKIEIENAFKENFKTQMNNYFPIACSKELGVSNDYKCIEVKVGESSNFQVAIKVDPLKTIDYIVFMTVNNAKDQIIGNPIVIDIPNPN